VLITTAFEPSEATRAELRGAVEAFLGAPVAPRFERDERIVFGVRLTVGGMRVDGSAAGSLEALADAFDAARRELARAGVRTADAAHPDPSDATPRSGQPSLARESS
jgi:hypothetical protein